MTRPKSTYKPVMGGYIGLWRIAGQWNEVHTETNQPFKTAVGALQAATDRLHAHWFPELRSANLGCSEAVSDPLGVAAWRKNRNKPDFTVERRRKTFV